MRYLLLTFLLLLGNISLGQTLDFNVNCETMVLRFLAGGNEVTCHAWDGERFGIPYDESLHTARITYYFNEGEIVLVIRQPSLGAVAMYLYLGEPDICRASVCEWNRFPEAIYLFDGEKYYEINRGWYEKSRL